MAKKKQTPSGSRKSSRADANKPPPPDSFREIVESVVIAFVLAFLFRTFVAEAFVIPTGSMATTLMGRHKELQCEMCGYWYQASASDEINGDTDQRVLDGFGEPVTVTDTTCPMCRYQTDTPEETYPSYKGDRILVTKFSYDGVSEPHRWDVIVFRYPEAAATNYIKRLIGLPGEIIRIQYGDIYFSRDERALEALVRRSPYLASEEYHNAFQIARKPPEKLLAMLRDVYDNDTVTRRVVEQMTKRGWPPRWQPCPADLEKLVAAGWPANRMQTWPTTFKQEGGWQSDDDGRTFHVAAAAGEAWLRYQHFPPSREDWKLLRDLAAGPAGTSAAGGAFAGLKPKKIVDFSAYNVSQLSSGPSPNGPPPESWVGDLALECELTAGQGQGEAVFELVKGGHRFQCRLDLEAGTAALSIDGGRWQFDGGNNQPSARAVRGPGTWNVRFANVDAQLRVWIDDELLQFDDPTTYTMLIEEDTDYDFSPVGVAARGAQLSVDHLNLKRDIFYYASMMPVTDYDEYRDYPLQSGEERSGDQFFALGDNSPRSLDSRAWDEKFVRRELLIGKAFYIYWPHSWDEPVPFLPYFGRMGFIR